VSFSLYHGEVLGLLGPNGAGKTTTMRVITGYLRPDAGRVTVEGIDAGRDPVAARRPVGYAPELAPVPRDPTVRTYLSWCARLRQVPRAQRAAGVSRVIKQAGLVEVANAVIGTLSKGMRQRVGLAQALVHEPSVLVLDEPTSGLDPRQVVETRALVSRLGQSRAVLFSSHLLSEVAELCQRVVVLDRGRVVTVSDVAELTERAGRAAGGPARLRIRVKGDPYAAARHVAGCPEVSAVEVRGGVLLVQGPAGGGLPEVVSAALVAAGFGLVELRSESVTLEEAYLRLVGG